MWNIEILNQFYQKSGRSVFWRGDIDTVFGSCHRYIEQPALFGKRHAVVLICNQLDDRIIFNLAGKTKFPLKHVDQDHIIVAQPLGTVCRHKGNVSLWIFFAPDTASRKLRKQSCVVQLVHIVVIPAD